MSQVIENRADTAAHFAPLPPIIHHPPQQIADGVFLIRQLQGEGHAPLCVYINSLVIDGEEPIIVDTGTHANHETWLDDVFGIVRPERVRWVVLSHDDPDHTGNLAEVLARCPNAVLVSSWLMADRMAGEINVPLTRMRWIVDGDNFQAGGRTIVALRPPTYDAPTTRGIFDTRTRVFWASDSLGTVVPHHVEQATDLDADAFRRGLVGFNRLLSPWAAIADPKLFSDRVQALQSLDAVAIASCHGPVLREAALTQAYDLIRKLPALMREPLLEVPGQAELEAMIAALTGEHHPHG
ncbi:MAG: MBL fold metallo-hydrolase [Candidatus Dormibacteria bacterium]